MVKIMWGELYYHNEKVFSIIRKVPIHNFIKKNEIDMNVVKNCRDWLKCDHVLKTQTHFLFVEKIEDVEFEEVKN
jgi:hypothetical protein